MRRLGLVISLVCLACGSNEVPVPAEGTTSTGDDGSTSASEDTSTGGEGSSTGEMEEPAWMLPEVWGVPTLEDLDPDPDVVEVELVADELEVPNGNGTLSMVAYNGSVPGPLLQTKLGDEVVVHFTNKLSEPTTVHWHGLRISDAMDGNPRIQDPVQPGETFTYRFVAAEAASYWYHPHVRANEQVEMGLQAPMTVHDPEDPIFDLERALVLDDIWIENGAFPSFLSGHMEQMHGRLGNYLLVNGQGTAAEVAVEQRAVERWRIVNTSNARTMELSVEGAAFQVVATDGGRVPHPYTPARIQVAVGQRYDLLVYYDEPGTARLLNHVLTLNDADEVVEKAVEMIVAEVAASERPVPDVEWVPLDAPPEPTIDREETLTFDAVNGADGLEWMLNGESMPAEPLFEFARGETVRLRLVNEAGPEHPFHLHGQFFTIVDDGRPETSQPGRKDTVLVPGQTTVEIIATMDNPGQWMAHCHILEHAELGMMGEIIVSE